MQDCRRHEEMKHKTTSSMTACKWYAPPLPLEYARLYLDGNLQMWVDAEDSLELY